MNIFDNEINLLFTLIMTVLAAIDLSTLHQKNHKDFKNNIVGLGVLGTFIGIFIGLQAFDPEDISGSIPPLLEGLKTAFWTSIYGMSTALIVTIIEKVTTKQGELIVTELEALQAIYREITDSRKETRVEFNKMRQSLDSAVAQISQGATKEIIKALEQVITDFNNNLTTQFGENFVQLNESVLKLLVWQENYKSTIEKTEMQLNKTMESLSATEKVITTIASENGKILDTYRSLGDLVKDSRRQIDELVKQTESLKSFNDKIEKSLSLQVAKFSEIEQSTKTLTDRISKSLSGQSEALKKLTDEIDEQLPKALGNLNKTLTSLTTKFADDYEAFLLKMNKLI